MAKIFQCDRCKSITNQEAGNVTLEKFGWAPATCFPKQQTLNVCDRCIMEISNVMTTVVRVAKES